MPYKTEQVLDLSLPRSFGQRGCILLTCCRALGFALRRTGEFTARRMAQLLNLTLDSLAHTVFVHAGVHDRARLKK